MRIDITSMVSGCWFASCVMKRSPPGKTLTANHASKWARLGAKQ